MAADSEGSYRGLDSGEAERRLADEGPNELERKRVAGIGRVVVDVMREPLFVLLVAGGIAYLALGNRGEAAMLLGFVCLVVATTVFQQRRTERALQALRDLSSPRALVIRGGEKIRISGREVVRGDILLVAEGDRVAADAVLLDASNLVVDESLLTGESVPMTKAAVADTPVAGDELRIFAGTVVTAGQAVAEVTATGARTALGGIGRALGSIAEEQTPLQRDTRRLVMQVAIIGLALCALVVVLYGLLRGGWLDGLLAGITLAMALLPEEFPVVLTVFLALGAWRLSRQHVLTRRVPAVETLGSATVLCVDKTGTLTANRMTVQELRVGDDRYRPGYADDEALPERFHELVEFSVLASEADPFDPMELAFRRLAEHYLAGSEHLHDDWQLARDYPHKRKMLAHTHAWRASDRSAFVVAAKGAPEAIADLCHLDACAREALESQVRAMAADGLRVLAMARAEFAGEHWPEIQHGFALRLVGLIGLADPLRPTAAAAIAQCRDAGIRVVMITGDYPETAHAVAVAAGLDDGAEVVTGAELEAMSDADLRRRINEASIFARIAPTQKLRLVEALKANGEVVAMTGDGVNDAPALKAAHIGVAMGERGTDVAREAAALVLLDDDFSSIVSAVRAGRRIFDNLRKAMVYIVAVHVPIAGGTLLPLALGWPLLFMPAHIAFLQLIIDPVCSVAFEAEPEEADVMQRPPRSPQTGLFDRAALAFSLLQGCGALIALIAVYGLALADGAAAARTAAFMVLVVSNIALILVNRAFGGGALGSMAAPNRALWLVIGLALALLAVIVAWPPLRQLFHFAVPGAHGLLLAAVATVAVTAWLLALKVAWQRRLGPRSHPAPRGQGTAE